MPPGAAPGSRRIEGQCLDEGPCPAACLINGRDLAPGGHGNLPFAVGFRGLYATVLERWWGADSTRALKGRFAPLDVVRT